jgi:hypothetical protein
VKKITRRQFGKAAAAGVAAAALGEFPVRPAHAHTGAGIRPHGVVLTGATLAELRDCVAHGGYDTVKVVSEWGLAEGWNPDTRWQVCNMTPYTIVRTGVGDGSYPYPDQVVNQIWPWYEADRGIMIELGNEPNVGFNKTDQFVWEWRYFLNQAIDACRANFPQAKLISPGLASSNNNDVRRWFNIAADVIRRCDYIGFHAYAWSNWFGGPDLQSIIPTMQQYFGDRQWVLTEYGINDTSLRLSDKGWRNAGLIHRGESNPQLPWNVWGATYFHLHVNPNRSDSEDWPYHIYPEGDDAYRYHAG